MIKEKDLHCHSNSYILRQTISLLNKCVTCKHECETEKKISCEAVVRNSSSSLTEAASENLWQMKPECNVMSCLVRYYCRFLRRRP